MSAGLCRKEVNTPQKAVRFGCIYTLLTKGDKLWRNDLMEERGFGLPHLINCGKVISIYMKGTNGK